MSITLECIHRYPVKGLSPEELGEVTLSKDLGLPDDRRFALALPSTRFDPDDPQWMPKTSFAMLARDHKLAALETKWDDEAEVLTVLRQGRQVSRGKLTEALGKALVEDFFAAYLGGGIKPNVVEGPPGHMFSDTNARAVSILNLASLVDLERVVGAELDPVRFRANLLIDGLKPWAEFDWTDEEITIGGARLKVTGPIDRCAATKVNPTSGEVDVNVPRALKAGFGHVCMGVYAMVVEGGAVRKGDTVVAPAG